MGGHAPLPALAAALHRVMELVLMLPPCREGRLPILGVAAVDLGVLRKHPLIGVPQAAVLAAEQVPRVPAPVGRGSVVELAAAGDAAGGVAERDLLRGGGAAV